MVSLTLCKLYNFKGKYCPNGTYNVIWRTSTIIIRNYCKNGKENQRPKKALEPPEEPTTCCMSGCANCVWLDYAEKLCDYYKDGGEAAVKEINERISDSNIKAYLLHEIRMRNKK